jgi:polyisoprenoid-binding protein YceI
MRPILIMAAAAALWSQPQTIAPGGGSRVEAIVEKTGLLSGKKHVLEWGRFAGTFTVAPGAVELTVEAGSVKVLDDWIGDGKKEDVRKETVGKDVLNAAAHPQIRFVSTGVSGETGGAFQVNGRLTIRGVTREVTLAVKRNGGQYEGETAFAMSAFGIKPPKAVLGAIGTKDRMTIRFRVPAAGH